MMKMSKWNKVVIMTKFKKVEKKYLFVIIECLRDHPGQGRDEEEPKKGKKKKGGGNKTVLENIIIVIIIIINIVFRE